MKEALEVPVLLRNSDKHPNQAALVDSVLKRIIVRAGRRSGKTVGAATRAVKTFLTGHRVLYAAPTAEQVGKFWFEVKRALARAVEVGALRLNETERFIEKPGTEQRIKAKTAWNADTLRGDYADELIFDEWQLMNEDAWEVVGLPMLLDNNGNALFIYTPPSLRSAGVTKAQDPRHAAKMFEAASKDITGKWLALHFTSHANPYISSQALDEIMVEMSRDAYRQEILAEDDELEPEWLVYKAWNEQVCKIDPIPIGENWLIYSGHDFGGANPAALFVAQDPATGFFYEFKEYLPGAGLSTNDHVKAFEEITKGRNVIWRSGGSHQEDGHRSDFNAHGWPIMEPKITGAGSVPVQIDRVIGMMQLNKIFVFKTLKRRIEELNNCLWAPDSDGRPSNEVKDEKKWHLSACARYLYCNFMPDTVKRKPKAATIYVRGKRISG